MNVLEVLTAAAGYLDKHGVESPRLNAEHLLAHVLGKKRLDLYMEFDRPLSEKERAPLRDLIRDRGTGKPLQHLLGTSEFFGRVFTCDSRGLIPRPETEQLIEEILKERPDRTTKFSVLDVGTGSGVIAITLALELPGVEVTAVDLSTDALNLAGENATRHGLAERITFQTADLLPANDNRFDLIVANLPYIPSTDIASLQREVLHDPISALDGGPDGLDFIQRLIELSPSRLQAGGSIALEIGINQSAQVSSLLAAHNYRDIRITTDYQNIERFVFAKYG